jgi:hypothetical protein
MMVGGLLLSALEVGIMAAAYGELRTGTTGFHPRWQRNRRKPLLASERDSDE